MHDGSIKTRVLLVEDSPIDVKLIMGLLSSGPHQYQVELADDLSAAVDYLRFQDFDIVLLDLMLPDSEGITSFTRLHRVNSDTPVIILTGLDEETIGVTAMQQGAQDFLSKRNINSELLHRSIRYSIERQALIQQRKLLEQQVFDAGQRERRRISDDLHDSLGQQLVGLSMLTSALGNEIAEPNIDQAETIKAIQRGIRDVIAEFKNVIHGITPVHHDPNGFQVAIQRLCQETQMTSGIHCHLESDEVILLPDINAATHLYRIAQESISNALKHSEASEILVTLKQDKQPAGSIELMIQNDGAGFDINLVSKGSGLELMAYRAQLIGATFSIESDVDGTVITCRIPAKQKQEIAAIG